MLTIINVTGAGYNLYCRFDHPDDKTIKEEVHSVKFLETLLSEEFYRVDALTAKLEHCNLEYRILRARVDKCPEAWKGSVEDY